VIFNVVRVGLLRMRHDGVEILLTFVVPIAFFTIFAFIFDRQIGLGKSPRVDVALVDEDGTELSRQLTASLAKQGVLRVLSPDELKGGPFASVEPARKLVETGGLPLAIVVPRGWSASVTDSGDKSLNIQILADSSDPVATQVATSLIKEVANGLIAEREKSRIQGFFGSLSAASATAAFPQPVTVDVVDLFAVGKANPVVSMYAAGIAVMFLLFGAVGNAGSLLEEEANQTLERLMCSQLSMTELLAGKWLLMTIVGIVQVTIMFVWAQLVFGVDLLGHVPGFAIMTAATAGAASSLALALAAACRTRVQLNAFAIILILCMSALGGSMVPRYVMSESMQELGRLTFNAWALDGYMKVLWRSLPLTKLVPELGVLVAVSITLFVAARVLARRWECV
jgi:ABC-2 type transport system permease protein